MTARWETTQVQGSAMRIYLGVPDRPGPHPVVLVAQHAPGVDASIQDAVHRLRREGYIAAAPELFHRQPKEGLEPLQRLNLLKDDETVADLQGTLDHLKTLNLSMAAMGIIGFCMGGRVAYLAASSLPGMQAAVVFYGGNIMKELGAGPNPFERSARIACPVLGCFGVEDTNPTVADVQKIDAELTRLGKWHEFHVYQGAGHAFHNFSNAERYRERASRAAWGEMQAFLDERLRQGATA